MRVVAAGAAVAIALARGTEEGRAVERAHPARTHPAPAVPLGPPVARRFAQLTPAQLRARIEDANHRVTTESNSDVATIWVIEPHGTTTNMVQLFRFPDAPRADAAYKMQKEKGAAVARDGNQVLAVFLGPPAAAEALLARLIR